MKIIEGLKKLRLLEKRMVDTVGMIQSYASLLSTEKPLFGLNEGDQKKEVDGLVQSNLDLMNEYLKLKTSLEKTNNIITVEINGETRTITEWLTMFRRLKSVLIGTFTALNTKTATDKLNRMSTIKDGITIIPCFDEKGKILAMRKWEDIFNTIESRLEIINATTDLVE